MGLLVLSLQWIHFHNRRKFMSWKCMRQRANWQPLECFGRAVMITPFCKGPAAWWWCADDSVASLTFSADVEPRTCNKWATICNRWATTGNRWAITGNRWATTGKLQQWQHWLTLGLERLSSLMQALIKSRRDVWHEVIAGVILWCTSITSTCKGVHKAIITTTNNSVGLKKELTA